MIYTALFCAFSSSFKFIYRQPWLPAESCVVQHRSEVMYRDYVCWSLIDPVTCWLQHSECFFCHLSTCWCMCWVVEVHIQLLLLL